MDMFDEAALLQNDVAIAIVLVEPGLTNADHLRMASLVNKRLRFERPVVFRIVRMHADSARDVVIGFCDRAHGGIAIKAVADRHEPRHASGASPRKNVFDLSSELLRMQIDVRVEQHRQAPDRARRATRDSAAAIVCARS